MAVIPKVPCSFLGCEVEHKNGHCAVCYAELDRGWCYICPPRRVR